MSPLEWRELDLKTRIELIAKRDLDVARENEIAKKTKGN